MLNFNKDHKRIFYFCYNLLNKNQRISNTVRHNSLPINNYAQTRLFTSLKPSIPLMKCNPIMSVTTRHKSKGGKKKLVSRDDFEEDEEEEDDDDDDENDIKGKGIETRTYNLSSIRVDLVLKTALGKNRKTIEEYFYKNKIRVSGKQLLKKGANVKVGDEIDLIKGVSQENPNFLTVTRIEILAIKVDTDTNKFSIKLRKSKSLLIENYADESRWKAPELDQEY